MPSCEVWSRSDRPRRCRRCPRSPRRDPWAPDHADDSIAGNAVVGAERAQLLPTHASNVDMRNALPGADDHRVRGTPRRHGLGGWSGGDSTREGEEEDCRQGQCSTFHANSPSSCGIRVSVRSSGLLWPLISYMTGRVPVLPSMVCDLHHCAGAHVGHGTHGTYEPLVAFLRPDNAGSDTADDHITVNRQAGARVLCRCPGPCLGEARLQSR